MKPNTNYKRDKIPVWINILTVVVICILIFQMISAFINPSWAYGTFENSDANRQAILTLAGRNFVMIVVTLLALKSQNSMFLAFTFLMNFAREFYDMLLVGYLNHFSLKGIGMMATFLVFLIPYVIALKKLRQLASQKD
ncbi:MAG: hypothetical protein ACOYMA_06295 [Bacteroidia bacterium]